MWILETLLLILSLPAFALACAVWGVVGYSSVRRIGYGPPGAAGVLLVSASVGIASTIIRQPPNSTSYRFFVDFFWATWLFAVATTTVLVLLLPHQPLRTFGTRRPTFPFVRVGQLLIASAWLVAALVIVWRAEAGLALAFGFLMPTGAYLVRRGRSVEADAATDVHDIETLDHPVLYLRAFNQERQFFAIGAAAEYGNLSKEWHARVSRPDQNVGGTFEEYFADAVAASLGRLVALGSPEDYMAPEGAARLYAKDSDWMQHVDILMRKARCILVEVGASEHLRWEFEHIRKEGMHQKLFVLTKPSKEGKWLAWAFFRLVWSLQGTRAVSFDRFAASLDALGYRLANVEHGPGSVIAFDADGQGVLLTTGAVWPGEFVTPIRDWALEHRLTGRHVAAQCSRCGRRVYAFPDQADGLECRDCRYGAPWKRIWKRIASRVYVLVWLMGIMGLIGLVSVIVPENSFVGRHLTWVIMPIVVVGFVLLFRILGRMDDPPPLNEADTSARPVDAAAGGGHMRRRKRR